MQIEAKKPEKWAGWGEGRLAGSDPPALGDLSGPFPVSGDRRHGHLPAELNLG